MSAAVFRLEGSELRTVTVKGEPWFVAADVARMLGYSATEAMTRSLDADEKGMQILQTPGGPQSLTVISEPGLYGAIIRSRVPDALRVKRWIKHEVLPAIRRTGSYATPETREQLLARAVVEANAAISEAHQQIEQLAPRAEAWDTIASAEGDYSVADASKMLARANIATGPQRLFTQMHELGWVFRGADGKWRAYASHVSAGRLSERPQSHHHPSTGAVVIDPPQVRITLRGLERLRVVLGDLRALEPAP
jgi:anti-repressor protein